MIKRCRELGLWTNIGLCFSLLCSPATHGQSGRVKRKPDENRPPAANSNQNEKPKAKEPEMVDGPNGKEIVYKSGDVDRKAIILKKPPPHYSRTARDHHVEGRVIVSVVLSSTGEVTNIRIVRGIPELNESAIDAAKQIKFEPAL